MTASTRGPLSAAGRILAIAALLAAALLGALAVVSSDDSAVTGRPAVTPLRITSGGEIATGFSVGRDRVVTVAHAVDAAMKQDGTDAVVKVSGARARILLVDRRSDLAVLGVPGISGGSPAVESAGGGLDARIVRLRNGRPSSLHIRVRRAIVAHVRAPGAYRAATRPALELAARVEAGDSGAPVVSGSGALVGVVFASSRGRDETAYAVDAKALTRLLGRD